MRRPSSLHNPPLPLLATFIRRKHYQPVRRIIGEGICANPIPGSINRLAQLYSFTSTFVIHVWAKEVGIGAETDPRRAVNDKSRPYKTYTKRLLSPNKTKHKEKEMTRCFFYSQASKTQLNIVRYLSAPHLTAILFAVSSRQHPTSGLLSP
nr:hypothetical protein BgiMline_015168 [Biomphalaria glabrata]